jgi:hypothetical protein
LTTPGADPEELLPEEAPAEPDQSTSEASGEPTESGKSEEPEPTEGEQGESNPAKPTKRSWLRPSRWAALAAIILGASLGFLGPTIGSATYVAGEPDYAEWIKPAGFIVALIGCVVGGLDVLFQREQDRARKVINETPTIYIYGSDHQISLGNMGSAARPLPGVMGSDAYMARQDEMLRDTYLRTIAQSKVLFWVSLSFMCLGGLILLVGAWSAVTSGGSTGKVEAGIITAVSGALANLASATFLYQANKSRAGLAEQAAGMQARSIADRRITVVREIAAELSDEAERVNSLKELMSALARSIDQLDGRHGTIPPEPAKSGNERPKPKSARRKTES